MSNSIEFKLYNGQQILNNEPALFAQIKSIFDSRGLSEQKEDILQCLDEEFLVWCMLKSGECVGLAWLAFCDEENLSELCWFATDKDKVNGLEGKLLLDKSINYCKSRNIKSIKFNCLDKSWNRIRNKEHLFEKFGYKVSPDEDFDMSIDI